MALRLQNLVQNYDSVVAYEFHDQRINESKVMSMGLSQNCSTGADTAVLAQLKAHNSGLV